MIRNGSRVTIHYTLTVDGETVESTARRGPLTFVQGRGEILPGLEAELQGGGAGDRRCFTLPPELGFGLPSEDAVHRVPRSILDLPSDLKPGQSVSGTLAGDRFRGRVVAIDADHITLDLNHPLAGKPIEVEVEVVEVSSDRG